MQYLKVEWKHDTDYPVMLYSELDIHRMELRKIDIYRDGKADTADVSHSMGSTFLSIEPLPSIEEIALSPEFLPEAITNEQFEAIWKQASLSKTKS